MGFFDLKISPAVPAAVGGAVVVSAAGHFAAQALGVGSDALQGIDIIAGIVGAAVGALVGKNLG
jgi:hypothetical protein